MWKFANPIKHKIPETRWPTAEEAAQSLLYSPIAIGKLEARSRTWVPAMVPWRATEDGFVTQQNLDWYRRFAEGRPGCWWLKRLACAIFPVVRCFASATIGSFRDCGKLVDVVREASDGQTLLFIQIIDFLAVKRRPEKTKYFQRFLQIDDHHRRALAEVTGSSPIGSRLRMNRSARVSAERER